MTPRPRLRPIGSLFLGLLGLLGPLGLAVGCSSDDDAGPGGEDQAEDRVSDGGADGADDADSAPGATASTKPTEEPTPTDPPTPTPAPAADALADLVALPGPTTSFTTTVSGADEASTLGGESDPALGQFFVSTDYETLLGLAVAVEPDIADDPLYTEAGALFGGPWEIRVAGERVFVRAPTLVALAGGDDDDWVELPADLAADLLGPGGVNVVADPHQVAADLAASGDVDSMTAGELTGVAVTIFAGAADLGASPVPVELWVAPDGTVRRLVLTLAGDGAPTTLTTDYTDLGSAVDVAPPGPADIVALPEGF